MGGDHDHVREINQDHTHLLKRPFLDNERYTPQNNIPGTAAAATGPLQQSLSNYFNKDQINHNNIAGLHERVCVATLPRF